MSVAAGEVSLDELLHDEVEHLVCGCRPTIHLCGSYDPDATTVYFKQTDDGDCPDCLKVWNTSGCGSCGCNLNWACVDCQIRYHKSTTN